MSAFKNVVAVHHVYVGDGGIVIQLNEISKETLLITILERKEYVKNHELNRSGLSIEDINIMKWDKSS